MQHPASVGPYGVPGNSDSLHGLIPRGLISMWSGLLSGIPVGWALCDGTLGTPNLVARFIRGISTSTTNPGTTGGSDSVTVVQNSHNHEVPFHLVSGSIRTTASFGSGGSVAGVKNMSDSSDTTSAARALTSTTTATNQAHDTRPAYFELAFIMKL
ncbi:MAG: hypothetical protein K8T20_04425 [Planctomycetes bacterium]|nr:hypothetical protein [Planctomycetota bacterium]